MNKKENAGFFKNISSELQGDHRKITSAIKSSMETERQFAESECYIKRIGELRNPTFIEELKRILDRKIASRAEAYDKNMRILKSINRQVQKRQNNGEYSGRLNVERERVAVKTKKKMPLLAHRLVSAGLDTYLSNRKIDRNKLSIRDRIYIESRVVSSGLVGCVIYVTGVSVMCALYYVFVVYVLPVIF